MTERRSFPRKRESRTKKKSGSPINTFEDDSGVVFEDNKLPSGSPIKDFGDDNPIRHPEEHFLSDEGSPLFNLDELIPKMKKSK